MGTLGTPFPNQITNTSVTPNSVLVAPVPKVTSLLSVTVHRFTFVAFYVTGVTQDQLLSRPAPSCALSRPYVLSLLPMKAPGVVAVTGQVCACRLTSGRRPPPRGGTVPTGRAWQCRASALAWQGAWAVQAAPRGAGAAR